MSQKGKKILGLDENGRICTVCKVYKTWDGFHACKSAKTGYGGKCKQCVSELHQKEREELGFPKYEIYHRNEIGRSCSRCKEFKEWSEFYNTSGIKAYSQCISCRAILRREYNEKSGKIKNYYLLTNDEGRICTTCKEFKTWENFSKHKECTNGRSATCRECKKNINKNKKSEISIYRVLKKYTYSVSNILQTSNIKSVRCYQCKQTKDSSLFYKNKKTKTGFCTRCKDCVNKNTEEYKKNNREKIRSYLKNYKYTKKYISNFIEKIKSKIVQNIIRIQRRVYRFLIRKQLHIKVLISNEERLRRSIRAKELGMGFKVGHIVTDETRKKLSIANTGKKQSPEAIEKARAKNMGRTPWNKGKTDVYTEETKALMKANRPKIIPWNKGKHGVYSDETRNNISQTLRKKSGNPFETRSEAEIDRKKFEYTVWREGVFTRDDWTCKKCNERGGRLAAHHIRNFAEEKSLRYDIDNGITLCIVHHRDFHKKYGIRKNNINQINEFLTTSYD